MSIVDGIMRTLAGKGDEMYGGEAVTQLEHALQCAMLARRNGAGPSLVTAALLHDYGHMVAEDEGAAERGVDLMHEDVAADHLGRWFGLEVTEPIRLHVAAKRYLCAVDQAYMSTLSPASVASLKVQGGPFDSGEVEAFRRGQYWQDAVNLRLWDDMAKIVGLPTPPLDDFRADLLAVLRGGAR
ncbi:MAG: HD domain-containing protein [Flavobacteriaceae bacterium]